MLNLKSISTRLLLYINTVKYLKFKQIFYRLYYKIYKIKKIAPKDYFYVIQKSDNWVTFPLYESKIDKDVFTFLNNSKKLNFPKDWNNVDHGRLWTYNLNYFEDLHSLNCKEKESQHKNYNRAIGDTWDDIRDFIVAHYINTRQDTDFWKESSSKDRWSDRLKELMEMWSVRMPRVSDYSSSNHMDFYKLGNTLWYQVLIGMKILNPKVAENELKSFNLYDKAISHLIDRQKFNKHILPFGENTNNFYEDKINNLYEYRKVN